MLLKCLFSEFTYLNVTIYKSRLVLFKLEKIKREFIHLRYLTIVIWSQKTTTTIKWNMLLSVKIVIQLSFYTLTGIDDWGTKFYKYDDNNKFIISRPTNII